MSDSAESTPRRSAAPSAAPSPLARLLAFGSIVLGGAAGGFIGWAFVDLQCTGDCTLAAGGAGLVGAVGAAIGVGIVAVLALRAMSEWGAMAARGVTDEQLRMSKRGDPRAARQSRPPRVR